MATNNAINLSSSGIVSYNGTGTFSALANPLTVANGGTGASSKTTYAVVCGGTTSTNPHQSIASVGSSGQVLTSNGASSLPTFQAAGSGGGGYTLHMNSGSFTASSGATGQIQWGGSQTTAHTSASIMYIPKAGTITNVYGYADVSGGNTFGTGTLYIRLNNTSDTSIGTYAWEGSVDETYSTTVSISVSAGDYIEIKAANPSYVSSPTVSLSFTIRVE